MAAVATVVLVLSMLGTAAWLTMVVLLLAAEMTGVLVLSLFEALAWLTMVLLRWLHWGPSCWRVIVECCCCVERSGAWAAGSLLQGGRGVSVSDRRVLLLRGA